MSNDQSIRDRAADLWNDEAGATVIEYGLMTALIALFLAGTVGSVGNAVLGMFQTASDAFPTSP